MFSITWDEKDHNDENVRKWYSGDMKGGKIYGRGDCTHEHVS